MSDAIVKVCGITQASEVDLLASRQVDFGGIWYGVPGGPADLPLDTWRELAGAAAATGRLSPVLPPGAEAITGWNVLHAGQP